MTEQPSHTPITVRTIPAAFNQDGYDHKLVVRCGRSAIFSKSRPLGPIHCFEVVRLEYRGAETIRGTNYPARECYPRSEDWGVAGWTCMTLEAARKKMGKLKDGASAGTASH